MLSPRHVAAFTLVEMLIVLSLIGILAALLLPRFEPALHEQLQATAQILVADLDFARSLAVAHNSRYRVTFDPAANAYRLEHAGSNSALDTLPAHPFHTGTSTATRHVIDLDQLPRLGGGVQLLAAAQVGSTVSRTEFVEFGPVGETTHPVDTVIWLAAGHGAQRRYLAVRVHPITGLATIDPFDAVGPPPALLARHRHRPAEPASIAGRSTRRQEATGWHG